MRSTGLATAPTHRVFTWFAAVLLVAACGPEPTSEVAESGSISLSPYIGRYRLTDDLVLDVSQRESDPREGQIEELVVLPSFWRSQIFLQLDPESAGQGSYRSRLHPEIQFLFERDGSGTATGVRVTGHRDLEGFAERLSSRERLPVELLLAGEGVAAFEALRAEELPSSDVADRAIALAQKHLNYFPSRTGVSVSFTRALAERYEDNAEAQATLGLAFIQAGMRTDALEPFRFALRLQPDHEVALMALGHLFPELRAEPLRGQTNGRMTFSLNQLFAPPSPSEIQRVRERWASRDLSVEGASVEAVTTASLARAGSEFDVTILSHDLGGDLRYGAVFVPQGAPADCCPVVVDVRGVSWDYAPLDVTGGPRSMEVLRDDSQRFVFVVPSLRGETISLGGESFTSEGDRRDGWDGGSDDVIAFLSAALQAVPAADGERVCVFGKSRGGSVALLAAARDNRFDCVVDWAGPADWFTTMGSFGWTLQELVAVGIEQGWKPGQGWGSAGQFIERVLQDPIDHGVPGLGETRLRMIASSPVYFADLLPPADLHYGGEDGSVGRANASALSLRLEAMSDPAGDRLVTLHEGAGHDMPWPEAYDASRAFLLRHLEH